MPIGKANLKHSKSLLILISSFLDTVSQSQFFRFSLALPNGDTFLGNVKETIASKIESWIVYHIFHRIVPKES